MRRAATCCTRRRERSSSRKTHRRPFPSPNRPGTSWTHRAGATHRLNRPCQSAGRILGVPPPCCEPSGSGTLCRPSGRAAAPCRPAAPLNGLGEVDMEAVSRTGRGPRRRRVVAVLVALLATIAGLLVAAGSAQAVTVAPVNYTDLGTNAPPATMGGYVMTPFGTDGSGNVLVSTVPSPLSG